MEYTNVIIACASARCEKRRRRAATGAVQSQMAVFLGISGIDTSLEDYYLVSTLKMYFQILKLFRCGLLRVVRAAE